MVAGRRQRQIECTMKGDSAPWCGAWEKAKKSTGKQKLAAKVNNPMVVGEELRRAYHIGKLDARFPVAISIMGVSIENVILVSTYEVP
eukprot:1781951-Rhodomonas_salina.2